MPTTTGGLFSTGMPTLTENADIQDALKIFLYGTKELAVATNKANLQSASIAGYIRDLQDSKVNRSGADILSGPITLGTVVSEVITPGTINGTTIPVSKTLLFSPSSTIQAWLTDPTNLTALRTTLSSSSYTGSTGTVVFSGSPTITTPLFDADGIKFPNMVVKTQAGEDGEKTVTIPYITDTVVTKTSSDILTNKTLTLPIFGNTGVSFTGQTSGATLVRADLLAGTTSLILPATGSSGTPDYIVSRTSADTMTNKTLTAPSISSPTISGTVNTSSSPALTFAGDVVFTGNVNLQPTGSGNTLVIPDGSVTSGKIADDTIVNADINASAAIADTKLATIATSGKVSNSATTATATGTTANTIVMRGTSGNFTAGTITANLVGDVTGNATTVTNGVYTTGNQNIAGTKTFSSTISGSITGNAGTVTNGVYTNVSYSNPSWITGLAWSKISTTPTTISGYGITDAQPLDSDLTAIAEISATSGLLKKTAANTWSLDTTSYLTAASDITGKTTLNAVGTGNTGRVFVTEPTLLGTATGTITISAATAVAPFTATVTASGTSPLFPANIDTSSIALATAGTGNLGANPVKVTARTSNTVITISSATAITNGTITSMRFYSTPTTPATGDIWFW
jgi:hypothetical protein